MATSPNAEKRMTSSRFTLSRIWVNLFFSVQHGIERRVVVHLHLAIHFHDAPAGLVVVQQFGDGGGHVLQLLVEYSQFVGTLAMLLLAHVLAIDLLLHVVYLYMQNTEPIHSPSGTFRIDACLKGLTAWNFS